MRVTTKQDYMDRILRVQIHIQNHLNDPMDLDELSGVACFSPYHFHRIFGAMVGESVKEYIRRLRLERAALDLKHTKLPVVSIALDAGYEAHESFTRAFKKRFGMTPMAFRKVHPKNGNLTGKPFIAKKNLQEETMKVEVMEFESLNVAFVRHVGPYNECQKAWGKLCSDPAVMQCMGPDTQVIGISYDDPDVTEPDKIRYDACVSVPESCTPGKDVRIQEIKAGKYAVLTHKGPYDGLADCYRWLYGEWLPKSGYEPLSAPPLEKYVNDPETTPPEDLVTEIRVPLQG